MGQGARWESWGLATSASTEPEQTALSAHLAGSERIILIEGISGFC
jgi:hypothetical protein